jgi:hypothetical protein
MDATDDAAAPSAAQTVKQPLLEQPTAVPDDGENENVAQAMHYEFESPPRRWWKGNMNLYLGICYCIVLWCVA